MLMTDLQISKNSIQYINKPCIMGGDSMPANDKRYMLYNVQVIYDKATCDFFNAVPIPLGQSQGYSELATSGIFPEHIKQDVGELKNEKVSLHIGKTYHSRINTQGA